jgi:hypothetical protein
MDAIAQRMKDTGQTREQVEAELKMMADAAERFRTGRLTAADKAEMRRCTRDFYDYGNPGVWRR